MTSRDPLAQQKRSSEEDHFHRRDAELIRDMRRRARLEAERSRMARLSRIADPEILLDLQRLGHTADTVALLPLAPLVQVAWIDGQLSGPERSAVLDVARLHGIEEGSPAYEWLVTWLAHRPSVEFFRSSWRALRAMLQALPETERQRRKRELVANCARVASASGGFLGVSAKVSRRERDLLREIGAELES